MRKSRLAQPKKTRAAGPVLMVFDPCREGDHDDCKGEIRQAGQRFVCACEHHVEAGTVDPRDFTHLVQGGVHA